MTLLYADSGDLGDFAQRYSLVGSPSSSTTTRFGTGRSISVSGSNAQIRRSVAASARLIMGFAFNPGNTPSSNTALASMAADGATVVHPVLQYTTGAGFLVQRGGTTIATSAGGLANPGVWNYIEMSATIDDAAGRVIVRVNGAIVIDFTGDTRNAGVSTNLDAIFLHAATGLSGATLYEDIVALNALGSAPANDFIGDVRVLTLPPTGAGANTGLTPSTGANWSCVDELPFSATDFVSGSAAGVKDTYATTDLPAGITTVYGVQVAAVAKKTDAGTRSLKTTVRSGGTDYSDAAGTALTTSDTTVLSMRSVDPATGVAWTPTGVNALEVGVEVA